MFNEIVHIIRCASHWSTVAYIKIKYIQKPICLMNCIYLITDKDYLKNLLFLSVNLALQYLPSPPPSF